MSELSLDKQYKCKIIKDINKMLIKHNQSALDSTVFDTLYDMDIDELLNAQVEIRKQLVGIFPRIEHY